jgi:hypothetical protein
MPRAKVVRITHFQITKWQILQGFCPFLPQILTELSGWAAGAGKSPQACFPLTHSGVEIKAREM